MILSQKETLLLEDLKNQEKVCIEKYNDYSMRAVDPKLQSLCQVLGKAEETHLDTITQMLNGTVPQSGFGGPSSSSQQNSASAQSPIGAQNSPASLDTESQKRDAFLCQDLLSTEKHVSSVYNTGIFEFRDEGMRNALNHIQKEEQEHGKAIFDYMTQNNLYS